MQFYQSKYAYGFSAALSVILLSSCSEQPAEVAIPEAVVAPKATKPDVMPALNLDILPPANTPSAIDYIIDGSASMCGYFNAELGITEQASPMTKLVQAIQSVRRSDDRILIFMQE